MKEVRLIPFDFSALGFLYVVFYIIVPFSIPLFGIGLHHYFRIIQNRTADQQKSEKIVALTWGALILALLISQVR